MFRMRRGRGGSGGISRPTYGFRGSATARSGCCCCGSWGRAPSVQPCLSSSSSLLFVDAVDGVVVFPRPEGDMKEYSPEGEESTDASAKLADEDGTVEKEEDEDVEDVCPL